MSLKICEFAYDFHKYKLYRNRERKRLELVRLQGRIRDRRSDFQRKLAHNLCRRYDTIILEDLVLEGMRRRWGRKVCDLAHGDFVQKLLHVATKCVVTVHKVDCFQASSKTCVCFFVNNELCLPDRRWTCPSCGMSHDCDLLSAQNIHLQGIADLASDSKTSWSKIGGRSRLQPRISSL